MKILLLVLIIFIIIYYHTHINENFTNYQMLSPIYFIDNTHHNRIDYQKPWYQKWTNEKSDLKCYINKHLQRKCYWSCV